MKRFLAGLAAFALIAAPAVAQQQNAPANAPGGATNSLQLNNGQNGFSGLAPTAHCALILQAAGAAPNLVCPVSAGDVLTDNGLSADPSFQAPALAQIGPNTVLGNPTGSTASPTAIATTGTGSVVEATSPSISSPTLTTPNLGAATGTSVNVSSFVGITGTGGCSAGVYGIFQATASTSLDVCINGTRVATFNSGGMNSTTIGGSSASPVTGTSFNASSLGYNVNGSVIISKTAPTLSGTGLGTGPTISTISTLAGAITAGTAPANATFTLTLPTAHAGWACNISDQTSNASLVLGQVAGGTTTTAVFQAYSRTTGATAALNASDVLTYVCGAY